MNENETASPEEVKAIIRRGLDAGMVQGAIDDVLFMLRRYKPNDRSEQDRYWAIAITDMEKIAAFFKTYVGKQ